MVEQITLYTNDISPFAHRVEIALEEAGISDQVIRYQLPLFAIGGDKPAWFSEKVNPLGTVPALAYGSQPAPDQPSDTSGKIIESLVIVEFISELFPDAKLVPTDPVLRAKARAIASNSNVSLQAAFKGGNFEPYFAGLDAVQSLLADGATYAVGEDFTIADIAFVPRMTRFELMMDNYFFGKCDKAVAEKVLERYKSPRYDKLREYVRRVQERPSFKKTYKKDITFDYNSGKLSPKK